MPAITPETILKDFHEQLSSASEQLDLDDCLKETMQ